MAINIRIPVLLLILISVLYFSLHQAIQNTPPLNFPIERISETEDFAKFNLKELETFLQGMLEKLKSGKSISHASEKNLKNIRALLSVYTSANQELVAKLIALINEILELNDELIHIEDGTHKTDPNGYLFLLLARIYPTDQRRENKSTVQ